MAAKKLTDKANATKTIRELVGSEKDIPKILITTKDWLKTSQLFLWPNRLKKGNFILSTNGDQRALKVNIKVIQDNRPIVDLEMSASLNQ